MNTNELIEELRVIANDVTWGNLDRVREMLTTSKDPVVLSYIIVHFLEHLDLSAKKNMTGPKSPY